MAYAAQSDIESVFGTSNVSAWSQLDETVPDTADTARIAAALAWATEDIENRMRSGQYAVPLTGTSGTLPKCVVDWCAVKAGLWLYRSRGLTTTSNDADADRFTGMETYANQQIDLVMGGKIRPALTRASSMGPTSPIALAGIAGQGSAAQNRTYGSNWWE